VARMGTTVGVAILCLLLSQSPGCQMLVPGTDGDDGDGTLLIAGGGDGSPDSPDNGYSNSDSDGSNSGSDGHVAETAACELSLSGFWLETGGRVDRFTQLLQAGDSVTATFLYKPNVCDHEDGTGQTSETFEDFVGTLGTCDGDSDTTIAGDIKVCRYGCQDECTNGFVDAPFTGTVSPDRSSIYLEWENSATGSSVPLYLDRLACRPRDPSDFGLPDTVEWTLERTPDPVNPSQLTFRGEDSAMLGAVQVYAGVEGTVTFRNMVEDPAVGHIIVIRVAVADGSQLEYAFYGNDSSAGLVEIGDMVHPATAIGRIDAFGSTFQLDVVGMNASATEPVIPDCIGP